MVFRSCQGRMLWRIYTSVHYVPSTRDWTEGDVAALHDAGRAVCDILRQTTWAELMVN